MLSAAALAVAWTAPAAAQEASFSDDLAIEVPLAAPVGGGVGFAYGMTPREAGRACRHGGHRFRRVPGDGAPTFRCSGTAAPQPNRATTLLRFCRGRLCEVDVLIPLEERNRGVSRWMPRYRRIRNAMERHYGAAMSSTAASRHCLGSNRALGRCVLREGAHVSAQWFPENGGVVSLHLVRIPTSGPHIRVTYASASLLSGGDRPPPRPSGRAVVVAAAGGLPF